ncbi:MAG: SDR family NAD(P)-dependent oxidoreductase [Acidimicrobiales bacterium]
MAARRFEGKVAFVTGGAGGIGGAISKALAQEGALVAVADLDSDAAKELAKALGALGLGMDVTQHDSVLSATAQTKRELGPIELTFNVAGIVGGYAPLMTIPVDAFDHTMAVNLRGMFLVMQAASAQMIEAKKGGAFVNVGSVGGFRPGGPLAHYGISKAAVHALTTAAARELAQHQIRVNAIAPGPVYTPMTKEGMDDPQQRAGWESRIPLGRIAETDDMVPLALYLASDEARNITGAIVPTDGGLGL